MCRKNIKLLTQPHIHTNKYDFKYLPWSFHHIPVKVILYQLKHGRNFTIFLNHKIFYWFSVIFRELPYFFNNNLSNSIWLVIFLVRFFDFLWKLFHMIWYSFSCTFYTRMSVALRFLFGFIVHVCSFLPRLITSISVWLSPTTRKHNSYIGICFVRRWALIE